MRNEAARGIIAGVPKEADTDGGGVTRNTVSVAQSTNDGEVPFNNSVLDVERKDEWKGIEQRLKQKWGCSQIEDSFAERDVMDWYEDDEGMRQWVEVGKEEGKILNKNGRTWFVDRRCAKSSRGYGFSKKKLTKEKDLKKKERKGKVVVWFKEKMEEKADNQLDTEEIVSWRSINQEEIDLVGKTLAGKI